MAVVFNKTLDFTKWVLSENNIILDFCDDTQRTAAICQVTYNGGLIQTLYPHPDGSFYTNLKEYLNVTVNDFDDDLNTTNLNVTNIDSFVYDWSKIYDSKELKLTITFTNEETEEVTITPYLILGVEQIINYKKGGTINGLSNYITSPLKLDTANRFYLKYWDGYPFDFGLTRNIPDSRLTQSITNNTNGITSPLISTPYDVNRIFLSNGDTTQTLEDFLPLVDGYNELELQEDNVGNIFIDLWKLPSDCGVYVKWLNEYGSYNYWLFNKEYQEQIRTSSLGNINNDFNNIGDTVSFTKSLGKRTESSLSVVTEHLTANDINVLKGIGSSPKVYLFTGERFTKNTFNDWLEVEVSNGSSVIKDFKNKIPEVAITLELPTNYNISL